MIPIADERADILVVSFVQKPDIRSSFGRAPIRIPVRRSRTLKSMSEIIEVGTLMLTIFWNGNVSGRCLAFNEAKRAALGATADTHSYRCSTDTTR